MLQKAADRVLSPLVFQILMLTATAFMLVPFIHYAYGGYVKYFLVFGIIVIVWQLFRKNLNQPIKDKAGIAALCFALSYFVSVVLNRGPYFGANIKQLVYMIVFFLLLFMFYEKSNSMMLVSGFVFAITFVFTLFAMVTFTLNIKEWYVLDTKLFIGVGNGRTLWGLYNPNTCGSVAAISVLTSLYIMFANRIKKPAVKVLLSVLLAFNIVIQYLAIVLARSRAALYGLAFVLAVTVFLAFVKNFSRRQISKALRVILALCLCLVVLAGVILASDIIFENREKLYLVSVSDSKKPELDTGIENAIEELLKKFTDETSAMKGLITPGLLSANGFSDSVKEFLDDSSSGRISIWKAGFSVFLDHPLFGSTREGLVDPVVAILENMGIDGKHVRAGGLHNIYITILCASGAVGFLAFMTLIGIVFVRFIKRLFAKEKISMELLFAFAMSFYFLVSDIAEARILYTVSFFNVVFWIYFGFMNHYSLKEKEKIEE